MMELTVGSEPSSQVVSTMELSKALEFIEEAIEDRFLILGRSDQNYMQCLCEDAGWILEKREGSGSHHFHAISHQPQAPIQDDRSLFARIFAKRASPSVRLDREQVEEAMQAYLNSSAEPAWLNWEHIAV